MTTKTLAINADELGSIILDIGTMLVASGASTSRVRNTITRIAEAYGYEAEFSINHRTLLLSLIGEQGRARFNSIKRSAPPGVNFKMLSSISKLSWTIAERQLPLEEVALRLALIKQEKHYSRAAVIGLVGLAGAAFCRVNGGDFHDMGLVLLATIAGLFVRQEAIKLRYNMYVCIYCGAFTASLITGFALMLVPGYFHESAFATSVLFLVPGVPFINTFSDMIEGNLHNALIRGLNCLIISFAIGMGLLSSMFIFKI